MHRIGENEMKKARISRTGAYGVAVAGHKILLVQQRRGPYQGKWDLPGGKIEFGETPAEAVRREFLEETGKKLGEVACFDHLSVLVDMQDYLFHQIGLIYVVHHLSDHIDKESELEHRWHDIHTLSLEELSPFAHEVIKKLRSENPKH
jgi:mutator protein MutT